MVNGIRASDLHGLNKGGVSNFHVGSRVRKETPEECWKRPKRCEYNNKDEDNSPKSLNDKNTRFLLCSTTDTFSAGCWPILFKVLTLNVTICIVLLRLSSFLFVFEFCS